MPAKTHDELTVSENPVSDGTVIWRYFKFERFVDILSSHSLWFSRPFLFEDQWEGLFPPSYARRTKQYAIANGIPVEEFDRIFRLQQLRHNCAHFVNCWHMSDHESDAMWKIYALAKTGIAIRSTVGDAKASLEHHNSGQVIYYDPSQDVRSASIVGPHDILFKRSCFSWEQEYRFWFDDDELLRKIEVEKEFRKEELSAGRKGLVHNLQRLIKQIVVAPGASDEFIESVLTACANHKMRWIGDLIGRSYSDRMWDSFSG